MFMQSFVLLILTCTCTSLFSRVISLVTAGGSTGLMNHVPCALVLLCRIRPLLIQKISSLVFIILNSSFRLSQLQYRKRSTIRHYQQQPATTKQPTHLMVM